MAWVSCFFCGKSYFLADPLSRPYWKSCQLSQHHFMPTSFKFMIDWMVAAHDRRAYSGPIVSFFLAMAYRLENQQFENVSGTSLQGPISTWKTSLVRRCNIPPYSWSFCYGIIHKTTWKTYASKNFTEVDEGFTQFFCSQTSVLNEKKDQR